MSESTGKNSLDTNLNGNTDLVAEFAQMTPEKIETLASDFPRLKILMQSMLAELGFEDSSGMPSWAKNAANEFFKCMAPSQNKRAESEAYQLGWRAGLASKASPLITSSAFRNSPMFEMATKAIPLLRSSFSQASDDEAANFFVGLDDGGRSIEKLRFSPQRTKIFLFISLAWMEIQELKSTTELYDYLIFAKVIQSLGEFSGKGGTDSREIRTICKIIGLKYENKGGRPRKLPKAQLRKNN